MSFFDLNIALTQDHRALEDVGQFAHVALPMIVCQDFHRLLVDALDAVTQSFRKFGDKKVGQKRDIVLASLKGRDFNGENIETKIQIGSKSPVFYLRLY